MSRVSFFTLSEKGLRDNNEDSYCAERIGDYYVFAVANGLGRHMEGEVASGIAIECLKNAVKFYDGDPKTMLKDAIFDADEKNPCAIGAITRKTGDGNHTHRGMYG
jgi:PPM family protein phosphatase